MRGSTGDAEPSDLRSDTGLKIPSHVRGYLQKLENYARDRKRLSELEMQIVVLRVLGESQQLFWQLGLHMRMQEDCIFFMREPTAASMFAATGWMHTSSRCCSAGKLGMSKLACWAAGAQDPSDAVFTFDASRPMLPRILEQLREDTEENVGPNSRPPVPTGPGLAKRATSPGCFGLDGRPSQPTQMQATADV